LGCYNWELEVDDYWQRFGHDLRMVVREDLGWMYMLDFSGALFDNFMINMDTFGFDTCLNSFGLCWIKGKA
jgi:hypothetical protein